MKRLVFLLGGLMAAFPAVSAETNDDEACVPVRQAIIKMIESPAYAVYPVVDGVRSRTPSLDVSAKGVYVTEKRARKKIGERETFRLQMKKIMESESMTGCKVVSQERVDRVKTIVYGYLSREGPERVWIGAEDGKIYRIRNGQGDAARTTAVIYGK